MNICVFLLCYWLSLSQLFISTCLYTRAELEMSLLGLRADINDVTEPVPVIAVVLKGLTDLGTLSKSQIRIDLASSCRATLTLFLFICATCFTRAVFLKSPLLCWFSVTWSVVAAVALLAEAPEQRGDVLSQDAAAVLDEESDQLTHLRGRETEGQETPPGYTTVNSLWLLFVLCCWRFIFIVAENVILFLCVEAVPWGSRPRICSNSANVQLCKSNTHTHTLYHGNEYIFFFYHWLDWFWRRPVAIRSAAPASFIWCHSGLNNFVISAPKVVCLCVQCYHSEKSLCSFVCTDVDLPTPTQVFAFHTHQENIKLLLFQSWIMSW